MITNKDLSIDSENGKIILNGDKYDLGTQGEIDTAVKDVYTVMGQNGAKNLIPYPYHETTKTTNGITFTDNGDGTITVNGTATQNSTFYFTPSSWNNEEIKGNVKLSSGGAPLNSNFKITVETPSGTNKNLQDNGELSLTITAAIKNIRLFVANGTTVDNVTIYPMIRLASDTDNTYQPYAMTNKQLTEQVAALDTELSNKVEASSNDGACNGALIKVSDSRMIVMIQNGGSATGENNMRLDMQTDKLRWQIYTAGTWTTIKEVSWDA